MTIEDEVILIAKKLDNMTAANTSDQPASVDVLNALANLKVTIDILQKTRIGMTVNNFRKKCNNPEACNLAKTLIKQWKRLLPEPKNESEAKSSESPKTESLEDRISPNSNNSVTANSPPNAFNHETTDTVRLKCREMLTNALKTAPIPEGCEDYNFLELAKQIEIGIHKAFRNTDSKYRNRVRSRVSNLKDTRNPELRINILLGKITAERFAVMTPEEMASAEMVRLRERLSKEALDDAQLASTGGTTTTLIKCGKCGKRNVMYNQAQTRSADEPMTTFCYCNECGNRWKFC